MSDESSILSPGTTPTVAVVAVVLALLGLALNAFNHVRTSQVAVAVAGFEVKDAKEEDIAMQATKDRLAKLESRINELEAANARMAAAATAPATE